MKSAYIHLLLFLAAISSGPSWSEPLGRLFFTPEKRQALDEQRRLTVRGENSVSITIRGRVQRSSGHRTTWLNDQPRTENDPAPGSLEKLQVGETIDLANGERRDLLHGGNVLTRKFSPFPHERP